MGDLKEFRSSFYLIFIAFEAFCAICPATCADLLSFSAFLRSFAGISRQFKSKNPPNHFVNYIAALVAAVEFHLAKSGRLLIVDEAQHLTNEAIDLLRCFVDVTEARLVLGGNNTVWDRFHAKGGIPFEQLTSAQIRCFAKR